MQLFNRLAAIVLNLAASEKRVINQHFKTGFQDRSFILVFKLVEKFGNQKELVQKSFNKRTAGAVFDIACRYLYHNLIRILASSYPQNRPENIADMGVFEIQLLIKTGLLSDAFEKANQLHLYFATMEAYHLASRFARFQIQIMAQKQYAGHSEDELIHLQLKLKEYENYERNRNEHNALYELLLLHFMKHGVVSSDFQRDKLNDLLVSETQLVSAERYKTTDTKRIHLLFQSVYFLMTGNLKTGLQTIAELNQLLESKETNVMWRTYINDFVKNSLSAFFKSGNTNEALNMIETLQVSVSIDNIELYVYLFIYKLKILISTAKIEEAVRLKESLANQIDKIRKKLQINTFGELALIEAVTDFMNEKLQNGSKSITHALFSEKQLSEFPVYFHLRLLNILINIQLQDEKYLQYEMRALHREMKKNSENFITELALLQCVIKLYTTTSQTKKSKIAAEFLKSKTNVTIVKEPFGEWFNYTSWLNQRYKF